MTSCCPPPRTRWSGATGAIARCKRVSTGCGRKCRSARALRWICGVKPTPKAVSKPWHHFIVHGLDKPGGFTTVSVSPPISLRRILRYDGQRVRYWYNDHKTKQRQEEEVSALMFIGRMVQHILPKGF